MFQLQQIAYCSPDIPHCFMSLWLSSCFSCFLECASFLAPSSFLILTSSQSLSSSVTSGTKSLSDFPIRTYLLLILVSPAAQSCPTSLRPHGLQHTMLPCPSLTPGASSNSCPSLTPGASSNSCPSSQWCHWTISSSVVPFSSCLQSFPASGAFPMSQFFPSGGQSIGVSASASVL